MFLPVFRHRPIGSIFNYFDVIGPKATEFCSITQNRGHYKVIQGQSFWYQSRTRVRLPVSE